MISMSFAERVARRIPRPWRSRCWYYPALYAVSFLYLTVVAQVFAPYIPEAVTPITKLLAIVAGLTYYFAVPLLAISLYIDASGAIVDSDEWDPNPYVYGGFGLAPIVAFTNLPYAAGATFVAFAVCLVYLVQRHRYMATP